MIVVVDSGGTKADWRLISSDGSVQPANTPGYSPLLREPHELQQIISRDLPPLTEKVRAVRFYGSGIHNTATAAALRAHLADIFSCDDVLAASDLLGACRATCGTEPGVVAILGTGAATCSYDGRGITAAVPSLGYIVGDEGSGVALGKEVLRRWFYGDMPDRLQQAFAERYQLSRDQFLEHTYRQPGANAYLASFASFAVEHEEDPYISDLLSSEFDKLIQFHLRRYKETLTFPCHFVGSVAWLLRHSLQTALTGSGLRCGRIIRKPIDELVAFHLKEL